MVTANPFGLHTVTPYLMVPDAKQIIQFLEAVFDARTRGDFSYRDDGSVKHAEVIIGDSVIMMSEANDEFGASQTNLYTYVDDCDECYQAALSAGGVSVMEPTNFPHGDRFGSVKDPAGNTWWIVTYLGGIGRES